MKKLKLDLKDIKKMSKEQMKEVTGGYFGDRSCTPSYDDCYARFGGGHCMCGTVGGWGNWCQCTS